MRFSLGTQLRGYCLRIGRCDVIFIAQGFGFGSNPVPVPRQLFVGRNVTKLFNPFGFFCGELCAPEVGKLPDFTGTRAQNSA